jgi:hypothetical protein
VCLALSPVSDCSGLVISNIFRCLFALCLFFRPAKKKPFQPGRKKSLPQPAFDADPSSVAFFSRLGPQLLPVLERQRCVHGLMGRARELTDDEETYEIDAAFYTSSTDQLSRRRGANW